MTPATVLVAVFFLIPTLLSYKRLVHEHKRMPLSILGWVAIVLVYYYAFAVRGLVIGLELSYPAVFAD